MFQTTNQLVFFHVFFHISFLGVLQVFLSTSSGKHFIFKPKHDSSKMHQNHGWNSVNIAGNKTWSGLMLKNFFKSHDRYGFVWNFGTAKVTWLMIVFPIEWPQIRGLTSTILRQTHVRLHDCNSSTLNQHQFQHPGCPRNRAGDMYNADQDPGMKPYSTSTWHEGSSLLSCHCGG